MHGNCGTETHTLGSVRDGRSVFSTAGGTWSATARADSVCSAEYPQAAWQPPEPSGARRRRPARDRERTLLLERAQSPAPLPPPSPAPPVS